MVTMLSNGSHLRVHKIKQGPCCHGKSFLFTILQRYHLILHDMYSYVLVRPISDTDTGDNMGLILCTVQLLLIATVQAVPQICCHVGLGSQFISHFLDTL